MYEYDKSKQLSTPKTASDATAAIFWQSTFERVPAVINLRSLCTKLILFQLIRPTVGRQFSFRELMVSEVTLLP